MIGEIRKLLTPFYNQRTHGMDMKTRPGLIIAKADSEDYVVLPISKISDSRRIDPVYDIKIDPAAYPMLSLNCVSYVRTHKQTVIHLAEIGDCISNMKTNYEDLFLEVLTKRDQFSAEVTNQAIG